MRLSDDEINFVEHFVRTELLQALQNKCGKHNVALDENDLQHFFGLYDSNPSHFKILLGDRKLLKAAAERVNEIHRTQSFADFLARFTMPLDYTIPKSSTDKLSVGTFFGKKVRTKVARQMENIPFSAENLSAQVLTKVRAMIDSFASKGLVSPIDPIPNDIVKIVNYGIGIRADVACIYCFAVDEEGKLTDESQKLITVPYESRGKLASYWNYGNLKKHFNRHASKITGNTTDSDGLDTSGPIAENSPSKASSANSEQNQNDPPNNVEIIERIQGESDESSAQINSPKKKLYEKFSAQNLNVMETVMYNGEPTNVLVFNPNDPRDVVKVVPIAPDGNCLFGAAVHQLYRVEAGSENHSKLATELRSKVVNHILENLPRYMRVIRLRLEEENYVEAAAAAVADADVCKGFVLNYLAKPGNWGGSESLMAICELFNANIIIFKKNESCYFSTGFNETYDRILFLAYSGEVHYESVCEISEYVMYNCVSRAIGITKNDDKKVVSVD